jgi:membrane protein
LLAGGLSYQAIFAVFAALWVTFSAIGLFLRSNDALQDSLFDLISTSVPGLIDQGDGAGGAIDPNELLQAGILGWTGAIALVGLLLTALNWLASGRDAVRTIFGIGPLKTNILVLKAKDLASALGFGLVILISAAITVFSTAALDFALEILGIDGASIAAQIVASALALLIVLALDTVVLAAFYRIVAGIVIPFRRLAGGALLGAVALGILKVLGSTLLGGASSNPLLASFAVIIGLLIWFNLICQVILVSAAWIAIGMIDAGIPLDPVAEEERQEKLRKEAEEKAAYAAAQAALRPRGIKRLFFWRNRSR